MTDSPCLGACRPDPETGLCLGCFRTAAETAAWDSAGEAERRAMLTAAERRRTEHDPWLNDLRCDCDH